MAKSVKPAKFLSNNAKRGIRIRNEQTKSNKCCTRTGLARANQLINQENLSIATLQRMKSFISRHGANVTSSTDPNSKLAQSLLVWGASPTKSGVQRAINWIDRQIKKSANQ